MHIFRCLIRASLQRISRYWIMSRQFAHVLLRKAPAILIAFTEMLASIQKLRRPPRAAGVRAAAAVASRVFHTRKWTSWNGGIEKGVTSKKSQHWDGCLGKMKTSVSRAYASVQVPSCIKNTCKFAREETLIAVCVPEAAWPTKSGRIMVGSLSSCVCKSLTNFLTLKD